MERHIQTLHALLILWQRYNSFPNFKFIWNSVSNLRVYITVMYVSSYAIQFDKSPSESESPSHSQSCPYRCSSHTHWPHVNVPLPLLHHWGSRTCKIKSFSNCQQHWSVVCMTCILWVYRPDVPILTCILFTFNWLTLTSEMHFVQFHPEVASCLLSRGKRKYASLGMRLLWKYIRNYFLVYHIIHTSCYISKTTKNLKLKFWICNKKNMSFHLISKNILLPVEPLGMRMWSA